MVLVHPTLAKLLAQWKLTGWLEMRRESKPEAVGPLPDDWICPYSTGGIRIEASLDIFHDLKRLGLRSCRLYDSRRTFISLALASGARKEVLCWVTHNSSSLRESRRCRRSLWPR
jgi:hypothetical protein